MAQVRVYSAAIAHCQFPKGVTREDAWKSIAGAFTECEEPGSYKNFLNASKIQGTYFVDVKHPRPGDMFEYHTITGMNLRKSINYVEIKDWKHEKHFSYDEIYNTSSSGDIQDHKAAGSRMEFIFSEKDGRVHLLIKRREQGKVPLLKSLSSEVKNSAFKKLEFLMGGPPKKVTKTSSRVTTRLLEALIERKDENRCEF